MKKKTTVSMIEGMPIQLIISFALPLLAGNLFQQLYNFADAAIVGRYIGGDALAAVGATSQVNGFLIALVMGITNGAGIIVSQCFGAREYGKMRQALVSMITALLVMVIVITTAGVTLSRPLLTLMNVPSELIDSSVSYMCTIFIGCLPMITYNSCSAVLRNLGNSRVPLYMLIVSSMINVCLDLLFVVKFNMGVVGAGMATVIAQMVSAILCLGYIVRSRHELNFANLPKKAEKDMIALVIKTGLPAGLQSCCINLGGMCVQGLINTFGKDAMAAYTASTKIDSFAIMIIISIAMAVSVFSGQNMGAGKVERIRLGLRQALYLVIPVCVIIAVIMLTAKKYLLSLFLDPADEAKAIEYGCRYLSVIGIGYIIAGIMQCHQQLLRGVGDVNICVAAGMAELTVRVVASYVFVKVFGMGLYGIWYAIPFSWGCGCLIPVMRYRSQKWLTKRLVSA